MVLLKLTLRKCGHYTVLRENCSLTKGQLLTRRKIRIIEGNAKCRRLKKLTYIGTLRQVLISVYWLEIANVLSAFSHVGIFDPALWMWSVLSPVAPLPSLWFFSPPVPFPCVNKYTVYTHTVCGGGYGVCGPQADKHLPQSPFTGQFFEMTTFCIVFYESFLSTLNPNSCKQDKVFWGAQTIPWYTYQLVNFLNAQKPLLKD